MNHIDWEGAPERAQLALQAAKDYMITTYGRCWLTGRPDMPDWYIVGGFLRDVMDDRDFKDIDIFIPGGQPIPEGAEELEYDLSKNFEVEVDGFLLNIIHMNGAHNLETLLTRCDVGRCQIGMDTDGQVWATDNYVNDVANNTLTVTRVSRWDHLVRMEVKFPDARIIDPFHRQHTGSREDAIWKHKADVDPSVTRPMMELLQ